MHDCSHGLAFFTLFLVKGLRMVAFLSEDGSRDNNARSHGVDVY